MRHRGMVLLLVVSVATLGALLPGCGDEESQPYGPPRVYFPKDEGAHPEMLTEWWYGNFALTDSQGREYGAMVSYANFGIRTLSISDLEAGRFHDESSISILDSAEEGLDLRWGSNDRWYRTDPNSLSYHLESHGTDIGLSLDLDSQKPPLLVGGDGLVDWVFGSSYYYSLTQLQVEGQIEMSGEVVEVSGIGWMDHQWMDFLPNLVERNYNWFSVQLDNDAEIILWQVSNPDGSIESGALTVMFPDNSVYHTQEFVLRRIDSWLSTESGREYGIHWRVLEDVHDLSLEIEARYPEQEIHTPEALGFTHALWEGRMAISGHMAGEAVIGTGYAELLQPSIGPGEVIQ